LKHIAQKWETHGHRVSGGAIATLKRGIIPPPF
jgi:hypothetical protein